MDVERFFDPWESVIEDFDQINEKLTDLFEKWAAAEPATHPTIVMRTGSDIGSTERTRAEACPIAAARRAPRWTDVLRTP